MSWRAPTYSPLDPAAAPSLYPGNLVSDGQARFAYAAGAAVQVTRRTGRRHGRSDFTLAHQPHSLLTCYPSRRLCSIVETTCLTRPLSSYPLRLPPFFDYSSIPSSSSSSAPPPSPPSPPSPPPPLLSPSAPPSTSPIHFPPSSLLSSAAGTVIALAWWPARPGRSLLAVATPSGVGAYDTRSGRGMRVVWASLLGVTHLACASTVRTPLVVASSSTILLLDHRLVPQLTLALPTVTSGASALATDDVLIVAIVISRVYVWHRTDGRMLTRVEDVRVQGGMLAVRGRTIAIGSVRGEVVLYVLRDGQLRTFASLTVATGPLATLSVHRNRPMLLVAGEDGRVVVVALPTGRECPEVRLAAGVAGVVAGACFATDAEEDGGGTDVAVLCIERPHVIQIGAT